MSTISSSCTAPRHGTTTVAATVNDSSSPADFDNQHKGFWYKAKGKNCATSSRKTGCSDWSAYSATIFLPHPATVTVGSKEPFAGQSVTMRASTSAAFGTASSYQWQEWSSGRWTNLASATSRSHAVTSSTSGVRYFRVVVTNSSRKTGQSPPVSIEWKPMTVTVSFSPDHPESGTASKRRVTLTATADAPPGVRYQWQQGNGNTWTNLGTKSTSPRRYVSFTTPGTRKFRVQVSHTVVPSVTSDTVFVTWDEFATLRAMLDRLHASTTADTRFVRDQTALLSCMNGSGGATGSSSAPTPSLTSFGGILHSYAGDVKDKMEDPRRCGPAATTMFNTNKTVSCSELATLKTGSTLYSTLLETPQGQEFETNLADPDFLKQVSYMGAHVADPGSLQRPVYKPSSGGASGQSVNPPPNVTLDQGAGLDCLPSGVDKDRLTLDNQMRVINCLVFATPHSFWVKGDGTRTADLLKGLIDSPNGRYNWLDSGDWECTYSPDGPLPSCLKHDVAYGGLQKIAGADTTVADGTELDEAWNPRNKALADFKFRADISRWGCQDRTIIAGPLCALRSDWIAQVPYFKAVADVNHKGWPVTTRDIKDFETRPGFRACADPVVPKITNLAEVTRRGDTLTTQWDWQAGDADDVSFYIQWQIASHPYRLEDAVSSSDCTVRGTRHTCNHDLSFFAGTVTGITMYVVPNDREYGGHNYGGEGVTGHRETARVGPFVFNFD